jgi:CDP-diacylglycerol--glycerol-3-phosphate 3-phosphatidyltransferase
MIDRVASLVLCAILGFAAASYAWRVASEGRFASARVDREGESVLLGKPAMELVHWGLDPVGDACVRSGVTANAVTWAALVCGLGAGLALGLGHFGIAALLTAFAGVGDVLDGIVARKSGSASDAGEVLDAATDRYVEFAFLAGLAFHLRHQAFALLLALGAIAGSFMVSYSTAKAEALSVEAPRGSMRRSERVAYLLLGVTLEPLFAARPSLAYAREIPVLAALGLVAVVGNASAIARLVAVAAALRAEEGSIFAAPRTAFGETARELVRHQLGALVATAVDFGMMVLLVEFGVLGPVAATAAGAACGAMTNLTVSRDWVFPGRRRGIAGTSARYAAVSAGSLALNTTGEALVNGALGTPYVLARILVSMTVSVVYNYPLHRRFVFSAPRTP